MAINSVLALNQFVLEMLYAGPMCWVFADFFILVLWLFGYGFLLFESLSLMLSYSILEYWTAF